MTDTAMAAALRKAGINPPIERLHAIIHKVLAYSEDVEVIQAAIVKSGDVEAALSLIDPQVVAARLRGMIKELARSSEHSPGTQPGHTSIKAERASGGGHLELTDGQRTDTPAAKSGAVHVIEHTRHRPGHAKQRSPAAKKALATTAARTIFDLKIGGGEMRYGDLTKWDCLQLKRKGVITNYVADRLLTEVEWPDEQQTRFEQIANEKLAKDIHDGAYRVLDQLGMTRGAA